MTSVLFVCLGNICRSPMAEALAAHRLAERGVTGVVVDSAGTSAHHAGEEPDPRTLEVLARHGIVHPMRSRPVRDADFTSFDWILAMDTANLRDLQRRAPSQALDRLHRMLEPTTGEDVPDPYYGGPGGFDRVHAMLDEALDAWIPTWVGGS